MLFFVAFQTMPFRHTLEGPDDMVRIRDVKFVFYYNVGYEKCSTLFFIVTTVILDRF